MLHTMDTADNPNPRKVSRRWLPAYPSRTDSAFCFFCFTNTPPFKVSYR